MTKKNSTFDLGYILIQHRKWASIL